MSKFQEFRDQNPAYDDLSDGELAYLLRQKYYPDLAYGVFAAEVGLSKDQRREMLSAAAGDGQELTSRGVASGMPAGNTLRQGLQGITFGFGDEIVAAGAATRDMLSGKDGSWSDRYSTYQKNEELALDRGRQAAPITSAATEIGGAMLAPGAVLKGAKSLGGRVLAGGLLGGLGGFTYGFGAGRGGVTDRVENARDVGLLSAAFGGAAPVAVSAMAKPINTMRMRGAARRAAASAPTQEELAQRAGAIYKRADQAQIPRQGLAQVTQDISQEISPRGINPRLTPKTAAVMDDLTDVATDPNPSLTFGDLEDVRRLSSVPRSDFTNPAEQRAGSIIASRIDGFVDNIDPKLGGEIAEARKMWRTMRKNEVINEAIVRAGNQASGFENGLRIQFRQILNNKKARAQFTEAELGAMRDVVKGGTLGNLLKKVGKLGFGRGQQSNVLSGTAGTAVFGPAAAVAGQAALAGSEALTARRAGLLSDLVRAGGAPNYPRLTVDTQQYLDSLLRRPARAVAPISGLLGGLPQ